MVASTEGSGGASAEHQDHHCHSPVPLQTPGMQGTVSEEVGPDNTGGSSSGLSIARSEEEHKPTTADHRRRRPNLLTYEPKWACGKPEDAADAESSVRQPGPT